ncbi:hypothetical protein Tco_0087511 [Tanacetum coccineum]
MEDKTHAYAERQAERKRKYDDLSQNNQNQQNRRQNTGQAYAAGNGDRKPYEGSKPLCSKCNGHHEAGPCPPRAPAKVYAVGNAGANPDNVVAGTFLLNNHYAYILFDTGADRSFVSTAFSTLLDIVPNTLDHEDCSLTPRERNPNRDRGDGCSEGHRTRLNIISCTKVQKYLLKGSHVFLAHVTTKEIEDKSEKKRLEDVPIVKDFPDVFLRICRVLSTDSTSGVTNFEFGTVLQPVARATLSDWRLPKMKELSSK